MDISSDLTELGKTPVAVISAGVKSILDISRTLEYLVLSFALFHGRNILIYEG
jgi:pseudouridine-5'-phosphate glycosidase